MNWLHLFCLLLWCKSLDEGHGLLNLYFYFSVMMYFHKDYLFNEWQPDFKALVVQIPLLEALFTVTCRQRKLGYRAVINNLSDNGCFPFRCVSSRVKLLSMVTCNNWFCSLEGRHRKEVVNTILTCNHLGELVSKQLLKNAAAYQPLSRSSSVYMKNVVSLRSKHRLKI